MRIRIVTFIFLLITFSTLQYSIAQRRFNPRNRYHALGANISAMNYVGEVDPGPSVVSPSLNFTKYNIGFSYYKKLSPHFFFRGNISYGRIKGSDYENADYNINDIHRKIRNLSFRNQIYELKADFIYDLVGNNAHFRKRPQYVPYTFLGIAYFHHNPEGKTPDGKWVKLKPLSTEGQGLEGSAKKPYSLHQIAIPIGCGLKYKLARQWDLAFEIGWRVTFTDYLDDIGTNYGDRDQLRAQKGDLAVTMSDRSQEALNKDSQLKDFVENRQGGYVNKDNTQWDQNGDKYIYSYNIPGAQRGDKNKDWYILTGFHLIYIFPERVICPKFRDK
jgi:hypothetical protein